MTYKTISILSSFPDMEEDCEAGEEGVLGSRVSDRSGEGEEDIRRRRQGMTEE